MKHFFIFVSFFLFFSCQRPSSPDIREFKFILNYPLPGYAQGLFLKDSILYVADGQAGLAILDISFLPDSIKLLSQIETGYNAQSVVAKDSFVFLGFNDINRKGIWAYNVGELDNPFFTASDEGLSYGYEIWLPPQDTSLIYVASGYWYYIEDVSGLPYYLSYAKRFHPMGKVRGGDADDNYVYLACEQLGLVIYYSLIPEVPDSDAMVSNLDTPNNARDVEIEGDFAFIADGYGGLVIVDITDREKPFIVSTIDIPGYTQRVFVYERTVYLASGDEGIYGVDISNIENPEIQAVYRTAYAYDVEANQDFIFVADRDRGIVVLLRTLSL